MDIKPIETCYNGYRFWSRLEARWAVFFDTGNIKYEYEPEGYKLDNESKYLPDFYLPSLDIHVEVKRDSTDGIKEITSKCEKAISWGGPIKCLLILSDVPSGTSPDGGIWHFPILHWKGLEVCWGWWYFFDDYINRGSVSGAISSAKYPYPKWYLFEPRNKNRKNSIKAITDYELHMMQDKTWNPYDYYNKEMSIMLANDFNEYTFNAYKMARQARFEHGETPTF